ncbi:MAG TPA: hypothetical protein VGR56_08625 [Nitrososphaerales archaeon]|nr:hypothetical protein [Nitrososphaerales archaeon]
MTKSKEDLLRERRMFADLMLYEWQQVENQTIDAIMEILKVSDIRIRHILQKTGFEHKLQFLKAEGLLDKEDLKTMLNFQSYRNRLFHGREYYFTLNEEEQDKIMDNAIQAGNVLLDRVWGSINKRNKGRRIPKSLRQDDSSLDTPAGTLQ